MDLASIAAVVCKPVPPPSRWRGSSSSFIRGKSVGFPFLAHSPAFSCCPTPVSTNAASARTYAKEKDVLSQTAVGEDVSGEADEEVIGEEGEEAVDFFDEDVIDDEGDELEDDYDSETEDDDMDLYVGDGGAGGGVSLAGTWWDKEALSLAMKVSSSFDGDLKIYAFRTTQNSVIQVRIEKMSARYGSPTMDDIEDFTVAYHELLDEAEAAGRIPPNTSLEVSSPGVERVVRVPEDLERFSDRPMYVRYLLPEEDAASSPKEEDGVFVLISFDADLCQCTWGIADVKINRQLAGKGRPLSKKQREWRLQTPFESLKLVHLYSDC